MLTEARKTFAEARWVLGEACATGLPSAGADIVVAAQALHWMEPSTTLCEVARILRPGGVFAAVDTRFPPVIDPELDVVFDEFLTRAAEAVDSNAPRWSKEQHLGRLKQSGLFRHVREVQLHTIERGDARRFVGFAQTSVDLPRLLKLGLSEDQLGLTALRAASERIIGGREIDWVFGYQVRVAVR
jgi:ubiquinone/menaquinone biosynthesis C-methylase UbiE